MDIISIFKKAKQQNERLDIQEAFNVYNLLRARYVSTQTVQLFKNFAHDLSWEVILDGFIKHFDKQISILEEMGERYRIIMPTRSPVDVKFTSSINDITDEYIYKKMYHDLIAQLMSLIHAVRSSSTNDKLRQIIETIRNDSLRKLWSDLLNAELEYYDKYLKYGKMKGWTKVVPIYGEPVT